MKQKNYQAYNKERHDDGKVFVEGKNEYGNHIRLSMNHQDMKL